MLALVKLATLVVLIDELVDERATHFDCPNSKASTMVATNSDDNANGYVSVDFARK